MLDYIGNIVHRKWVSFQFHYFDIEQGIVPQENSYTTVLFLFVVVGCVYFDANIILYQQALSSGDNGQRLPKSYVFSLGFCTAFFRAEHISAHTIFFL